MPDYSRMYQKLFSAQANAIECLQQITQEMIKAQRQVEEMFISSPEADIVVINPDGKQTQDVSLPKE